MKKIFLIFCFFTNLMFGLTDEALDIKIDQEVRFGDGFGTITGYPQNITQELRDKLKFIGEYNLDKNTGNLTIKFKRVQFDGRIYELTESFEKKLRLKKPSEAKLRNGAKIKVAGGNRNEILDIVNQKKQAISKQEENKIAEELKRPSEEKTDLASILGSTRDSGSGNSSNYPYYYPADHSTSGVGDYSNSTTNKDGTCKSPSISDGIVSIYTTSSAGGACKLFVASEASIYYKTNTPSCQNKVDFKNKVVQVGREGFVALEDNKEYRIVSCQYTPDIKLKNEIGKCKAIPDYKKKIAKVQKQFYYEYENQRYDIGGCTTTEEEVLVKEDFNKCNYRHDFVRKMSIKQAQFFYMYDNKRYDIGECIDKDEDGFRFSHYEDDSTCQYQEIDGRVVYQRRVVFDGLDDGRKYATDCRVVSSGGLEIKEEFAGYVYHDNIKQAQRKVNQYFIIPQTSTKKYLNKNVLTDKIYSYEAKLCKYENDDKEKISKKFSKIFFVDTDEKKEVIVSDCSDSIGVQILPYVFLGEERSMVETIQGKTLIPESDSWKIYGTEDFISNTPNATRNIFAIKNYSYTLLNENNANCKPLDWNEFNAEQKSGLNIATTLLSKEQKHCGHGGGCSYFYSCSSTLATKPNYGTNQVIKKEQIRNVYRRGDGSKYYTNERFEWRAK